VSLDKEFEKLKKQIERLIRREEKAIVKNYKSTLTDLRNLMANIHAKHEIDGQLTFVEMAKYDRLKKMDKEITVLIQELYKSNTKVTATALREVYKQNFYGTRSIIETATGKRLRGILKQEVLDRAITNEISGLKWTERMGLHRNTAVIKIRETVRQGLQQGSTYKQMSDRLLEAMNNNVVNPTRIVRTESHRVMEASKLDSLENAHNQGVKMIKRWVSAKDERVREVGEGGHTAMDGQEVAFGEDFYNPDTGGRGPTPGQMGNAKDDCNCRCIFVIDIIQ
jgi:hypothetical protein